MEVKEETSDTDSGIILHSGPDSPCTVMKDVTTHTRAVRLKLQSLEERLEACVSELKKLCIREAELTGQLSSDYPLLPGENLPKVRRRIGAAFKLDDQSILHKTEDSALSSVEAALALQQQIVVATRHLCQEGATLSKAVRRSHQQQCRQEESKLRQLQEDVFQLRLQQGRSSPHPAIAGQRDQTISDDSSLSDSAVLDDEERASQASHPSLEPPPSDSTHPSTLHVIEQELHERHAPPHTLGVPTSLTSSLSHAHSQLRSPTASPSFNHTPLGIPNHLPSPALGHTHFLQSPIHSPAPSLAHAIQSPFPSPSHSHSQSLHSPVPSPAPSHTSCTSLNVSFEGDASNDAPPIQHSPWSESSLDQPYEKPKKKTRSSSCRSSSSNSSPVVTPTLPPLQVCVEGVQPLPLPSRMALRHSQSNSAPCTPEMQLRRGLSLRLPSSEMACTGDDGRGRPRLSRRRTTNLSAAAEHLPPYVGMGNPIYHSSSEDSASEHSAASYTSSPCREHPPDQSRLCQSPYGHQDPHPYPYPHPQTHPYPPAPNGFYRNPQHQSTPAFSRPGHAPHQARAYTREVEYGRMHTSRYVYQYEEAGMVVDGVMPGQVSRMPAVVPAHLRLARAPSLREYSTHHQARGAPRQLEMEELKSWHQRQQQQHFLPRSRPRSLDRHRQGALRIKNAPSCESPLSQQPRRLDQPPQPELSPRLPEQNGTWTTEDEDHIISQV